LPAYECARRYFTNGNHSKLALQHREFERPA